MLGRIALEVGRKLLKEIQAKAAKQTEDVDRARNSAGERNEPDKREMRRMMCESQNI